MRSWGSEVSQGCRAEASRRASGQTFRMTVFCVPGWRWQRQVGRREEGPTNALPDKVLREGSVQRI